MRLCEYLLHAIDGRESVCYNPHVRCCRSRQAVGPSHPGRESVLLFPPAKGGMPMYITLADLFQYSLVLIGIVGLILSAVKKK